MTIKYLFIPPIIPIVVAAIPILITALPGNPHRGKVTVILHSIFSIASLVFLLVGLLVAKVLLQILQDRPITYKGPEICVLHPHLQNICQCCKNQTGKILTFSQTKAILVAS